MQLLPIFTGLYPDFQLCARGSSRVLRVVTPRVHGATSSLMIFLFGRQRSAKGLTSCLITDDEDRHSR